MRINIANSYCNSFCNLSKGINIYTRSEDWLGKALTNPSYAKNNISKFDIEPPGNFIRPENFVLPKIKLFQWTIKKHGTNATAENVWGKSVEAWYFANTLQPHLKFKQIEKEQLMKELIICKFKTYPLLIEEIDKRGGLEFLNQCSHIVSGNKNWEGIGTKSNFIKVLISAFKHIKNISEIEQQILF